MYLDVLNTKSKSEIEINGLAHEKSQMAQMVFQCAQMHILETSPKFSTKNFPTIVLLHSS